MAEFAESVIILPDGPDAGFRYRLDRQPYTRLWFEALDSGRYNEAAAVGPTQSGKTLSCWVIPILWHLFERQETVVGGLPTMAIAKDKWLIDLLPVVKAGQLRALLPDRGLGSNGAFSEMVSFRNGVSLRFMSGGGDDKSRAAFTTRVTAVTEADGLDTSSTTSREASKAAQIKARTLAHSDNRMNYWESTASVKQGLIWQLYLSGTESRIACPCPHCKAYVSPEREHLGGWQDATSADEAAEAAFFFCPACGEEITEAQRVQMNLKAKLLHRGQTITRQGKIKGNHPRTRTLGFRWSAFNNLFAKASDIGAQEWSAAHSDDSDNAQKAICQFIWAIPHEPEATELNPLTSEAMEHRGNCPHKGPCEGHAGPHRETRGVVPEWAFCVTLGIDIGNEWSHWVANAWAKDATSQVIDYGVIENHRATAGADASILAGLRSFRDDVFAKGWAKASGAILTPACVLVDGRWCTNAIYEFARETQRCFPSFGSGSKQPLAEEIYRQFDTKEGSTRDGENYRIRRVRGKNLRAITVLSDPWKAWFHRRLTTEPGKPGAMTFFRPAKPLEHRSFAKHLTAERQLEEFVPGKGWRIYWERVSRNNHWFDAGYLSCVAGHLCGARLLDRLPEAPSRTLEIAPVLPRNWGNDRGFDAR